MTSSPINKRSLTKSNLLFVLFAGLLLVGNLLTVPVIAAPSALEAADPPTLVKHLRASLHSSNAMHRQNALMDVVMLSACQASCIVQFQSIPDKVLRIENESGVGTAVDLDALAPDLMAVYRNSRVEDGEKLMALNALIHIDNREALVMLIDDSAARSSQQSEWVHKMTQRSLASHYLEMYPELMTTANRNNVFSLEDVDRAEALRVKQAKKNAKKGVL